MKYAIGFILTLTIEIIINGFVANYFDLRFIDIMFFMGLAFSILTFWFSSSNGMWSQYHDKVASLETGIKFKSKQFALRFNAIFTASLLYFVVSLVIFILLITEIIPPPS